MKSRSSAERGLLPPDRTREVSMSLSRQAAKMSDGKRKSETLQHAYALKMLAKAKEQPSE